MNLFQYPEKLVVAKLGAGADIPTWAESSSVFAIIATATETTVVCAGRSVPKKVPQSGPYVAFAAADDQDLDVPGVLHGLLAPLAEAGISIFALSTYPTDWILVPIEKVEAAAEEWRRRGHTVAPAPVAPTPGKS
ncbi:MAG: ACT domain-containing protein [Nocardioidaceae bacterium]|nr:ACT domain-containing protein [Nocardioidaceae bacterium]